jgi:hypothetical protein
MVEERSIKELITREQLLARAVTLWGIYVSVIAGILGVLFGVLFLI